MHCNKKNVLAICHDTLDKTHTYIESVFQNIAQKQTFDKSPKTFQHSLKSCTNCSTWKLWEYYIIFQCIISWLSSISSDSSNICNHSKECTIKGWVIHIFNSELGKQLPKSPREPWTSPFFLFFLISSYYSHHYLILADLSALNVRQKFFGSVCLEVFLFWLDLVVLRSSPSVTQAGGKLTL